MYSSTTNSNPWEDFLAKILFLIVALFLCCVVLYLKSLCCEEDHFDGQDAPFRDSNLRSAVTAFPEENQQNSNGRRARSMGQFYLNAGSCLN